MTPFHLQPESVRVARMKSAIALCKHEGYQTTPDYIFAAMWGFTNDVRMKRLSERPFIL